LGRKSLDPDPDSVNLYSQHRRKTRPYPALLIQEIEDAQLGLDEVNAGLVVVEIDHLPLDPFLQHKQHVNNDDIRIRTKKGLETFSQLQNSTFLQDLETVFRIRRKSGFNWVRIRIQAGRKWPP
jgi:hypothetical protein